MDKTIKKLTKGHTCLNKLGSLSLKIAVLCMTFCYRQALKG